MAKKINGSVTARLSVPVVVNVPFTVKSPTQVISPPTFKLPTMPAPPAVLKLPVVTLLLSVESVMATLPLMLTLPSMPAPPSTINAPVSVLILVALAMNVARLVPLTVTLIDDALAQYKPVLLAAKLTTLGLATVPALNIDADKFKLFSAPAR